MGNKHAIQRKPEPDSKPGIKLRIEDRFSLLDAITILPYRSFGTEDGFRVWGRVVEDRELRGSADEASTWRNVVDMIQRFESDEIAGARLRAHFDGRQWETTSDKEGFFVFDLDLENPVESGWHDVRIELLESVGEPAQRETAARVLVPSRDAQFAVVSDLDDTVIETRNTDFFRKIAIVFGKHAGERIPFPGVPALYRALEKGADGNRQNPIFYVSKSGWNIYDLFEEFLEMNDIPKGPLFLSDLRFFEDKSRVMANDEHKFENIDLLLRTYPDLPFILIGDSGMKDPERYELVARAHPGRIKAVYIHDVTSESRDREVDVIARKFRDDYGIPFITGETTLSIAEHAAEIGLITNSAVDDVRRDVTGVNSGDEVEE